MPRPPTPRAASPTVGSVVVIDSAVGAARVSDSDLVRRGRGGEPWALEAIYRRHVLLVAGIARRLLRSSADVDDVVQDTFLAAFAKLHTLKDPAALRGWLAQIAVSRVHSRARWRRVTSFLTEDPRALLEQQADTAAGPEQLAELALIDRALGKMAARLRTPWVLRHVIGLPLEEIATACECSLATAKRRIGEAEEIVETFVDLKEGRP